jgi:hypothetical protein
VRLDPRRKRLPAPRTRAAGVPSGPRGSSGQPRIRHQFASRWASRDAYIRAQTQRMSSAELLHHTAVTLRSAGSLLKVQANGVRTLFQ